MTIPGLQMPAVSSYVIGLNVSDNTPFDLAAAFGNPVDAINYRLYVSTGVVQGSTTQFVPAIDATGLHADSVGLWFINGQIVGRGGKGASVTQVGISTFYNPAPGGGGGGAGAQVGAGGTVFTDGTDGDPGTLTTGGAGGAAGTIADFADAPTPGEDGGDAVWTNHAITAVVEGGVRGGGGGGGFFAPAGDAGGDLDQGGFGALAGGAGNAVRLFGTGSFSYSGGGTVGVVSA